MKKSIKKIDYFLKITDEQIENKFKNNKELRKYISNSSNVYDSIITFTKDVIIEYINDNSNESDKIAQIVFGEEYLNKFNENIDSYIEELAIKIVNERDNLSDKFSGKLLDIIKKCSEILSKLNDLDKQKNDYHGYENEVRFLMENAKFLGFDVTRIPQPEGIVVYEKNFEKLKLIIDGEKIAADNVILSIGINCEEDGYVEIGAELNGKYYFCEFDDIHSAVKALKHPENIEFK